MRVAGSSKPSV